MAAADLEKVGIVVDIIFHAQHCQVSPQRHLARAVAVEIELVLHKVCKVLVDRQKALQSLQVMSCGYGNNRQINTR